MQEQEEMRSQQIKASARIVAEQLSENPMLGIPVDPDVADCMGAFQEDAIGLADMVEDGLLTVNNQGEVFYEG